MTLLSFVVSFTVEIKVLKTGILMPEPSASPRTRTPQNPFTLGGPPLIMVSIRDKKDYIRVLVYSYYYITITGWGSS